MAFMKEWNSDLWEATNKTRIAAYLCFEWDLFLGILEWEHERDRRGRVLRLEERLLVPTVMGRAALATEWIKSVLFFNSWTCP